MNAHAWYFKIGGAEIWNFEQTTVNFNYSMPNPYSLDLRWRIIWLYFAHSRSQLRIAALLHISERTVRRYVDLFYRSGDVRPRACPQRLLGEFEQIILLRLILANPGIYLYELKSELVKMFRVSVSKATICRTLRYMGCTRRAMHHVALQLSEVCRGRFVAEVSIILYDPSMLIWLDETGCDGRNTIRKYGYSLRGMPLTRLSTTCTRCSLFCNPNRVHGRHS